MEYIIRKTHEAFHQINNNDGKELIDIRSAWVANEPQIPYYADLTVRIVNFVTNPGFVIIYTSRDTEPIVDDALTTLGFDANVDITQILDYTQAQSSTYDSILTTLGFNANAEIVDIVDYGNQYVNDNDNLITTLGFKSDIELVNVFEMITDYATLHYGDLMLSIKGMDSQVATIEISD